MHPPTHVPLNMREKQIASSVNHTRNPSTFNYLLDLVIDRLKKRAGGGGRKEKKNLDLDGANVTTNSIEIRRRMFPQTASLLGKAL